MKNINNAWKIYSILFAALCVTYALSDQSGTTEEQPRVILNAKESGIDDIDIPGLLDEDVELESLDVDVLDLEEDSFDVEVEEIEIEEPIEEVVEAVEEPVEDVIDVAEIEVVEEPVEEIEVAEVIEEPVEEVIEAVEEPVEDVIDVAEIEVAEEPVEEIEVAEVIEEPIEEVIEAVEEPVEDVIDVAEIEVAEEPVDDVIEAATDDDTTIVVAGNDPVALGVDEAMALESARRNAYDMHVEQSIQSAQEDLTFAKYDQAIEKLKNAEQYVRNGRKDLRDQLNQLLAEAYYRRGLRSLSDKNYDAAESDARNARQLSHPAAERLQIQIKEARENKDRPAPVERVKRWEETEYLDSIEDIRVRLARASEYYSTGEYDLCRREVEFCLRDYPWCKEAVGLLRKVNKRLDEFYDDERVSTRTGMIADVTRAWTPDNYYGVNYEDAGYDSRGAGSSADSVVTLGTTEEMEILKKMQRIVIPEIEFRQANITDVITFLSDASREYDPDEDVSEERRGINIILNLNSGSTGSSSSSSSSDDTAMDFLDSNYSDTSADTGVSPITTSARFVTLYDAMEMIMDIADLKYRVKGNMVLVMPENAPDGELIHRMYPVLPSFVEKAKSLREEEQASGDFGDAIQIESTKFEDNQDWKKFFGELGVQWPEGSTVKYVGSIGKLIVKNTSEQLASLEKVLAELNVTPHQVEIEVRFVEVMQTDLDSLGFEWSMNSNWGIAENRNDGHLDYSDRRRIEMGAGNITRGFNFLSNNQGMSINDGMPLDDGIIKISSILTNPELSVVLHMLSTKKNSDLLSAPKVVTASGREATIKVVTEYIYPTNYEVEMLESDNGDDDGGTTYAGAVVEPSDFMTREVGVILSVTPEVAPDGSRIYLRLAPSVISEPIWKNYGSEYPMSVPVENTVIESVLGGLIPYTRYETKMAQLNMEQPFFPVRSVVTELDVYNGATVVMGGMITEDRVSCEDKIPILGDIPLIGHLFRNRYEQSEKRNLLLFVTARLVDAGGREVKNPSVDGIFSE